MMASSQTENRLVFGLGSGFCYSLRPREILLPKLLNQFENDVLISTVDMSMPIAKLVYETVGQNRLYLDSGGFTLFKDEMKLGKDNPEFHKNCEKMKAKFLKLLDHIKPKETFELDNEYFRVDDDPLSPKNYCRQEIYDKLGFYPTPVFKMHQGFEYWKRLCESELYPKLAIGGLAQTRAWGTHNEEIKLMMDYARQYHKKVHLLGCQNVEAFKTIQPDTVDYSIFQLAINLAYARKEHPELNDYKDLAPHIVLYATARAMARGFLCNAFAITENELFQ